MRALQITGLNESSLVTLPDPVPGPGEALVALRAAALNHRDVWIKIGQYAGITYPCIPGSDGAGTVVALGEGADPSWLGRAVIIDPALGWGRDTRAQGPDFDILGLRRPGTLATHVRVPATLLVPKPEFLSWDEAAALPLAGLTAWRALLTRAAAKHGDRVLVTGIGGGVALFVLQFAVASGLETWVTSSSPDKIAQAVRLGARGGFVYGRPGWAAAATAAAGQFTVIVDGAGGEGFGDLIDLAAPGGRIALYGATRGNPPGIALRKIFWRQLSLLGSTMGSPADWAAMTRFVNAHWIKPVVAATFPLEQAAEAFALMEAGGQFGKIVLQIAESAQESP